MGRTPHQAQCAARSCNPSPNRWTEHSSMSPEPLPDTPAPVTAESAAKQYKIWQVIAASAAGTMIEWYDFYIFGSLAPIISGLFFPKDNPTAGYLLTLATFATGFAVRPFGALFFGRIGDLVGRKYAFLVTLLLMGGATTVIGVLPTYTQIGIVAPLLLVVIRLLQGLALGGEYGGAAVYVAEHSPDERRGFYTSFIQITATLGLFVSLAVVLSVRLFLGEEEFKAWGWRIPFLLSALLVGMSLYIRLRLKESPIFTKLKKEGKTSSAPIKDSFGNKRNWKVILLALFGATAGQGVIWYTGQFYALFFLQNTLKVSFVHANIIVAVALALAMPLFVFFGSLSDRIGRKKVMMAGNLLAALSYYPIYMGMKAFSEPYNPIALTGLVFIQVVFVTLVYGPIAAYLVEAFPAKIRYTSLSLPYHVGNGVFGGLLPFIASAVTVATGNIYAGLLYPIAVASITFVVGSLYLKETKDVRIWEELEASRKPEA
ncbi:metabolite MFS transporter [Stigmatella aurantiaca DW4/3-1]|uniref:Metabolite MFS transporter n=2 Tax=Stigmatella aurantiaca (strain DW4/3-1) TaxID=378806 RepID=Q09BF9_STIAD|nr:metabolite MFS transporter [Stigmatella aurantiaca DW4/3-1]